MIWGILAGILFFEVLFFFCILGLIRRTDLLADRLSDLERERESKSVLALTESRGALEEVGL